MRVALALALDVTLLLLFAVVGRRNHGETGAVAETIVVAAPFVVGWLVAAAAVGLHRRPWTAAVALRAWAVGVPLGLLLRAAWNGGVAPAFVGVALLVNLVTLVGWRVAAGLVRRGAGEGHSAPGRGSVRAPRRRSRCT